MYEFVLIIHVLISVGLVGMILLQQGKGAEAGAAFGGGASQTVFGSAGSGNFITRTTAVLATAFFATSLTLSYIAAQKSRAATALSLPVVEQAQSEAAQPIGDVPNFATEQPDAQ